MYASTVCGPLRSGGTDPGPKAAAFGGPGSVALGKASRPDASRAVIGAGSGLRGVWAHPATPVTRAAPRPRLHRRSTAGLLAKPSPTVVTFRTPPAQPATPIQHGSCFLYRQQ